MTQKQRLHEYLLTGQVITRLQGWDKLGIIELPARVSELRAEGVPIETVMHTVRNRYGEHVRVAAWFIDRDNL